ncbi:hypothetical protein BGZ63DRAFT_61370 [Mariannaea sp. PMI_226]|nr:hypothetical protein BGZ63DRAFT_61370 [Mariannaea sp. PMI_226]
MQGRRLSDPAQREDTKKLKTAEDPSKKAIQHDGEACAKWCKLQQDGTSWLDETKIKSMLSPKDLQDINWMGNVIRGRVLNARVYPLIFETTLPDAPDVVRFRTLSFFVELLRDSGSGSKYAYLTSEQQRVVAVGVRDLYIADLAGLLSVSEKSILRGMVNIITSSSDEQDFGGLSISPHLSKSRPIVKFIENLDDKIGGEESELFAQVMQIPRLFAVFVSPADLSYHNFENIIPIDAWFESKLPQLQCSNIDLEATNVGQILSEYEIFSCRLQGAALGLLKDLSALDLYVTPLNQNTRGGKRFIFHSALLSTALTKTLECSNILDKLAGGQLRTSFEFVNYVFRCNTFNPDDSHFQNHLDTPYYDGSRSQISKYTMLIFLTGGCNKPVLRIEDVSLCEVEEFGCVIFDQKYEHEGWPFLDGRKVFIRTELVFKDENLTHDSKISALFSEACYMTGQGMFDQELSTYANECFERANSLHWAVEKAASQPPVYFIKQFLGVQFVTNGYRYWFLKSDEVQVKEYALVAVLDYFNCKIGSRSFHSLVTSTKIQRKFDSLDEIWSCFDSSWSQGTTGFRDIKQCGLESIIKKEPTTPMKWRFEDWDGDAEEIEEYEEDGDGCCPFHSFPMFNPWKNSMVMEAHDLCSKYALNKLFGAPILILDGKIAINKTNIEIVGDKINFLRNENGTPLPRINFAACWGDESPAEYVVVGDEIPAPALFIPPLSLNECPHGYQLTLDFFRNDWMVEVDDERTIFLPEISELPENRTAFQDKVTELEERLENLFS